ncbi:MAG: prepilin-type N-terminal cleavage/methylation domain-containing protein, partial [Nitrospinae bacterium]|nr:prepilin-type N-terminal cleavage/methylation domain-containing protein [Nitrospinota bacterium]
MKNEKCKLQNAKLRNFKIFNIQSSIVNLQWGFTLLEVMVAIVILG